jgi:hypothetical protein
MRPKAGLCAWILAAVMGVATGGMVRAASQSPQDRNAGHDQDYSKNKNYQTGVRDGQYDRAHNKDHSKKRHFKKDDDQKAYETGYQQGRQSDRH